MIGNTKNMYSSDALELNYLLVENRKRIAEEKAEAAAQAEAAARIAADQRNTIITRTASRTIITRSVPPQLSRSPKTIRELLAKGHSPSDIALHLGIPLSDVHEIESQSRSPTYDRLLRKFMETGELEYPDQYVSYSIFQR